MFGNDVDESLLRIFFGEVLVLFDEIKKLQTKVKKLQQELAHKQEDGYLTQSGLSRYLGISTTQMGVLASKHDLYAGESNPYGIDGIGKCTVLYHPYRIKLIDAVIQKLLAVDEAWSLWLDYLDEMKAGLRFVRTTNVTPAPMKRGRKPKAREREEAAA
jgi:hypothetical protein